MTPLLAASSRWQAFSHCDRPYPPNSDLRWALTNSIITLTLGTLIGAQWPISGLWIIGLFMGIHLICLRGGHR